MKKRLVSGIFALIALCGIAVLGASPQILSQLVESVRAHVFESTRNESVIRKNDFEIANDLRTALRDEKPQQDEQLPDQVLYDNFFRMLISFDKKIESQNLTGEKTGALANYFKNRASLTDNEYLLIKELAAEFADEMLHLDHEARSIIEEVRLKSNSSGGRLHTAPPARLIDLQNQRNLLAIRYKERLRETLGEGGFNKLDEFVKSEFAGRLQLIPLSQVDFTQHQ